MIEKIKAYIPTKVYDELPLVISKFGITTEARLSHFLGQCYHESGGFLATKENLNYSSEALLKVFPKYFDAKTALQYHRQPIKIASRVYANRMGNGDEASGDGYKHRGLGYIQLTGKDNQTKFFLAIGLQANTYPEIIAEKYPLLAAAWFWSVNGLNAIADKGVSHDIIVAVTKKINGGTIGLEDREIKTNIFWAKLCKDQVS